jgi:DNA-binding MarR family transcriptional regulator
MRQADAALHSAGDLSFFIVINGMATKRSYTQEVGSLGAHLRAPADAMASFCYVRLADRGFSDVRAAHGVVFRHIAREGSRVTDMASAAQMSKQGMAEIVEHLRQRGYVALSKDPTDRRANLVCMTDRGWKVQRALIQAAAEFERQCARAVGESRWAEFRGVLRDMFSAWPALEPATAARRTAETSDV